MVRTWLFSGQAHLALARQLARCAGIPLGRVELGHFPDGEIRVQIEEQVRGDRVILLQPTCSSQAILELLLLADALQRCGPRRLDLIVPYFGYGRQERRAGQSPVSAGVLARLLNGTGADGIVTLDLHAPKIARLITRPHQQLQAASLFAAHLRQQMGDSAGVVVSPDRGSRNRARRLSRALGIAGPPLALEKRRLSPRRCQIDGGPAIDLHGRWAILVDDIVSTGGTLIQAADWLARRGAHPIWACVTHLVGPPDELTHRLASSPIERLIVSDSLPWPEPPAGSKLEVVRLASLLASAVVHADGHGAGWPATSRMSRGLQALRRQLLCHCHPSPLHQMGGTTGNYYIAGQ